MFGDRFKSFSPYLTPPMDSVTSTADTFQDTVEEATANLTLTEQRTRATRLTRVQHPTTKVAIVQQSKNYSYFLAMGHAQAAAGPMFES